MPTGASLEIYPCLYPPAAAGTFKSIQVVATVRTVDIIGKLYTIIIKNA